MVDDTQDISLFNFAHRLRVRWAEADMQGIVFNGHYLTYFDIGVTEYFRVVFDGDVKRMAAFNESVYVVKSVVNYRDSARFDDWLDINVRTSKMGNSSLVISFAITRDGQVLVDGENIYVHAPGSSPTRVSDEVRTLLSRVDQGSVAAS
ncbi:MAG: acyl-CoA thioesterase [Burkholderiaceae bacterium]